MEDHLTEYQSREAEIKDGWRGTWLGLVCVLLLVLVFRERSFANAYTGEGGIAISSLKVAVAIAFATSLFFIKDARGYNALEKIRFHLFSLLFWSIFALWFVPFTNRFWPAQLDSELVSAYVHRISPSSRIAIGKRDPDSTSNYKMYLEVGRKGTNKVARPELLRKSELSALNITVGQKNQYEVGQILQVRRYRGRWGQDFISLP